MHELNHPDVPTYFIAWGEENIAYGINYPTQQTTSGLENFETFIEEAPFLARLGDFNVDIFSDDFGY